MELHFGFYASALGFHATELSLLAFTFRLYKLPVPEIAREHDYCAPGDVLLRSRRRWQAVAWSSRLFQLSLEGFHLGFGFLTKTGFFLTLLLSCLAFAFGFLTETGFFLALLLGFLALLLRFLKPASYKSRQTARLRHLRVQLRLGLLF